MCKLYSIKIYRGARECTNSVQENSGGYTLLAVKDQEGNVTSTETKSWTLHFRGKGEQVADGTGALGQENEVIASSGNIENKELGILRGGQSNSRIGITYTNQGEIGMLRVRVKCMEYNQNYVTDFADRNFTLALHETMTYPYTWDFTDVNGFSSEEIEGEYNKYNEITDFAIDDEGNYTSNTWYEPLGRELSMWDNDGNMILRASTEEYQNQNMIFENSKGINGNQLYANGKVIPETKGLWFYFDNNDPAYNGSTQITEEGLRLSNTKRTVNGSNTMGWWNTKMVIPNVPSGAAVYARVKRDPSVLVADYSQKTGEDPVYFLANKYQFGHMSAKADIADGTTCRFYKVDDKSAYEANDNDDEYIIAILNTGEESNLTLTLNGWILKKLSISQDFKKVNIKGWTTESRGRVIDPELTAYLTGYDFETCLVTGVDYDKKTVTLTRMDNTQVMTSLVDGENGANIIHNKANEEVKIFNLGTDTNKNEGFHLFVPDMNDYMAVREDERTNQKSLTNKETNGTNMLIAQVSNTNGAKSIPASSKVGGKDYTNYALTYQYYRLNEDGSIPSGAKKIDGDEAFYRIAKGGASSKGNQGYLPLLTSEVLPTETVQPGETTAKYGFTFVFEDLTEIPTEVLAPETSDSSERMENNVFYNLNGQKLNGLPTKSGLYIMNGKKVIIK